MSISEDSSKISATPGEDPSAPGAPGATEAVNPAALSVAQLARMLGVSEQKVQEHIAAGAPTHSDGSVNLVHYAAWLNRELRRTDGD